MEVDRRLLDPHRGPLLKSGGQLEALLGELAQDPKLGFHGVNRCEVKFKVFVIDIYRRISHPLGFPCESDGWSLVH